MSKYIKELIASDVRERIGDVQELLVIDPSKVDAITTNQLRLDLRKKEIKMVLVKNSLARMALNQAGVSALDPILAGPSALVWGGEDIVALSKEMANWAKQIDGLEIKGGTVEGTTLSAADVEVLSKSPGRLELISQIAGLALSPGGQLVGALLGPGGKVSGQVKAHSEREEE
ncbi:50S ribosomal protein L10 [Symmachiella dynata]|uniref:Large ribosomal subunit protein uL10 n=1 Tax=Symmachiella dynata TaxID=2527995 RepID=A0A517ZWW3_9PLAN|nr:50S ribosomal protein L10 [Symmachiella dynata]QDT51213.1 50S ribosomal protein L10 [Symmachiella dynata]QDU46915.1 50S ribosomal protein L10 [Symmachiella dynata]